jgi:hypothetical protein
MLRLGSVRIAKRAVKIEGISERIRGFRRVRAMAWASAGVKAAELKGSGLSIQPKTENRQVKGCKSS